MLNFDSVEVLVNGTGILAQTASISSSNATQPIYAIGKDGIIAQSSAGPLTNTFRIDYTLETNNEPNFQSITAIKNSNILTPFSGVNISIGNVSGSSCYLTSYQLKVTQNDLVQVSVGYTSFLPVSGDLSAVKHGVNYYTGNGAVIGWSVFVDTTGNYNQVPTYTVDYQFGASWQPIYPVTGNYPSQVICLEGSERFVFTRNKFISLSATGEDVNQNLITGKTTLDLYSVGFLCNSVSGYSLLNFDFSSGIIQSVQLNASMDDIVRVATTVNKYF